MMVTRKSKVFGVFEYFKKGVPEALKVDRKYKCQNETTEELMQGIYEFKVFTRNSVLFLSPSSLSSQKERLESLKKRISNRVK